jgi:hypothetical protein
VASLIATRGLGRTQFALVTVGLGFGALIPPPVVADVGGEVIGSAAAPTSAVSVDMSAVVASVTTAGIGVSWFDGADIMVAVPGAVAAAHPAGTVEVGFVVGVAAFVASPHPTAVVGGQVTVTVDAADAQ